MQIIDILIKISRDLFDQDLHYSYLATSLVCFFIQLVEVNMTTVYINEIAKQRAYYRQV